MGQPVAVVVAETREQAFDSAEAVIVDYEPLAPLMDVREAAQPDAHQWTQSPGNCCFSFRLGTPQRQRQRSAQHQLSFACPATMDASSKTHWKQGYVGSWDAIEELYTLHAAAGKPQTVGRDLAHFIFGLPEDRVRAVAKDVGGGFGAKNPLYPEQALVLWTAKKLGRPVRWQAVQRNLPRRLSGPRSGRGRGDGFRRRREGFGLRVRVLADLGAFLGPRGSTAPNMWRTMGASVYNFPAVDYEVRAIHTHNMPTSPLSRCGRARGNFYH